MSVAHFCGDILQLKDSSSTIGASQHIKPSIHVYQIKEKVDNIWWCNFMKELITIHRNLAQYPCIVAFKAPQPFYLIQRNQQRGTPTPQLAKSCFQRSSQ